MEKEEKKMSRIQIINGEEFEEIAAQVIFGCGLTDNTENENIKACVFTTGTGIKVGRLLSALGNATAQILYNITGQDKSAMEGATVIFLDGFEDGMRNITQNEELKEEEE